MQRRWAAIYFAFFVVLSASGLALVATASPPPVEVDGELRVQAQSTFTYEGQQYQVGAIGHGSGGGGGHGGGGGGALVSNLTYTDPDAAQEETFTVGDPVEYSGGEYNVSVENATDGPVLVLTETFPVDDLLAADPAVYNSTVTSEDEEFVRYRANDTLVSLDEYLPEPDVDRFREGDTIEYSPEENVTVDADVSSITQAEATIAWTAPETFELDLAEGENVTMANGQTFLVHFPSEDRVLLTTQFEEYRHQLELQEYFHERQQGFWGITYIGALAALLVLGMAYMPVRG